MPIQQPNTGEWNEWARHVLGELERLNKCYESLDDRIRKLDSRMVERVANNSAKISNLEGKAMAFGSIAAIVVTIVLHFIKI